MSAKSHLRLVAPAGEKRAVAGGRLPNSEYRKREHLTAAEIDKLIEAAKGNRHGHRDAPMILVAYRHGLRASEICELRWGDHNFGRRAAPLAPLKPISRSWLGRSRSRLKRLLRTGR